MAEVPPDFLPKEFKSRLGLSSRWKEAVETILSKAVIHEIARNAHGPLSLGEVGHSMSQP